MSFLGVFCPTYASSWVASDVLGVSLTQSRAYVGGGTVWQSLKHLCPQTRGNSWVWLIPGVLGICSHKP